MSSNGKKTNWLKSYTPKKQKKRSLKSSNLKIDQKEINEKLKILQENSHIQLCADCNAKSPKWVSLKFGIFLCATCAQVHRSLGNDFTNVKSINMNTFDSQMMGILDRIDNSASNAKYEATYYEELSYGEHLSPTNDYLISKPTSSSSTSERKKIHRSKIL